MSTVRVARAIVAVIPSSSRFVADRSAQAGSPQQPGVCNSQPAAVSSPGVASLLPLVRCHTVPSVPGDTSRSTFSIASRWGVPVVSAHSGPDGRTGVASGPP
jgi:hypothetical protein